MSDNDEPLGYADQLTDIKRGVQELLVLVGQEIVVPAGTFPSFPWSYSLGVASGMYLEHHYQQRSYDGLGRWQIDWIHGDGLLVHRSYFKVREVETL